MMFSSVLIWFLAIFLCFRKYCTVDAFAGGVAATNGGGGQSHRQWAAGRTIHFRWGFSSAKRLEIGGILRSWAVKDVLSFRCRYFEVETGYHFCSQSVPVRATFFPFCPSGCASFLLLSFFSHDMNEFLHGNFSLFLREGKFLRRSIVEWGIFLKGRIRPMGENGSVGHGATHSSTKFDRAR